MFVLSSDDQKIEIPDEVCSYSQTLSNLIEDLGTMMEDEESIPTLHIESAILEKIIRYLVHQHATLPEDQSRVDPTLSKAKRTMTSWDKEFINGLADDPVGYPPYFTAINYLEIKCLLDVFAEGFAEKYITCPTPDVLARAMS